MFLQLMKQIEEANIKISEFFNQYYGDKLFFCVTVICFIYLFWNCKELRFKFLLPIVVMFLIIMNPVLYYYIFSKVVYWRLFWTVPNVAIMGASIVVLLKQQKKVWIKWGILIVSTLFVFAFGKNSFQVDSFEWVQNWEKISKETIWVCREMLEIKKNPKVIVPIDLSTEIRQYSPEIEMLYGRNATGDYIRYPSSEEYSVYYNANVENPNYYYVLEKANELDIDFVVVYKTKEIQQSILRDCKYKQVYTTTNYILYQREE